MTRAPEGMSSQRFVVTRTSEWDDSVQPCPEAIKGTMPVWDFRTCKSPEEFNARGLGDWFGEGTSEHGYITGPRGGVQGIKRRLARDAECWYVDIASLADLMAFWEKHGPLVITTGLWDRKTPAIEIYDGYRE